MIEVAAISGIGTPIVFGLLKGIGEKTARKIQMREYLMIGLGAFTATAIASYLMQPPEIPAGISVPCPPIGKSVSGVTVQLGRYAGGIKYPGQMQAIGGSTNGSLIYVD